MFEPFLSTEYDDITNENVFNCAFFSKYYHSNNIMVFTNIVQDERVQMRDLSQVDVQLLSSSPLSNEDKTCSPESPVLRGPLDTGQNPYILV